MNELPPMTQLDYMVTSKELTILKLLLPFIPKDFQPFLAVYIKYSELMSTMKLFNHNSDICNKSDGNFDLSDMLHLFTPYMSKQEQETMDMFENIKNAMDMFNQYKDLFGDCDFDSENPSDIFEQLSNFMNFSEE